MSYIVDEWKVGLARLRLVSHETGPLELQELNPIRGDKEYKPVKRFVHSHLCGRILELKKSEDKA